MILLNAPLPKWCQCLWLICATAIWNTTAVAEGAPTTIVLIGGMKSHGPAQQDFPNGVRLLENFIESSPDIQALKPVNVAAFTGLHYLAGLDQPQLRELVLDAIVWTAGTEAPKAGVRSGPEDAATRITQEADRAMRKSVTEAVVTRPADNKVIDFPWGQLTWYVSRELGNSDTMTVGQAVIRPGKENPPHYHPNCDEVLHVVKGHILHTMNERTVEMRSGDTVSIPTGVKHNAKNIGTEDAVLAISFSSADRQVVGE